MAGIQALVNQKAGSLQGNPNPIYYQLAASQAASKTACNSDQGTPTSPVAPSSACVFNDVTKGDISVPCIGPNCFQSSYTVNPKTLAITVNYYGALSSSSSGFVPAYAAGTGWDFATGLGSLNATNLVNSWPQGGGVDGGVDAGHDAGSDGGSSDGNAGASGGGGGGANSWRRRQRAWRRWHWRRQGVARAAKREAAAPVDRGGGGSGGSGGAGGKGGSGGAGGSGGMSGAGGAGGMSGAGGASGMSGAGGAGGMSGTWWWRRGSGAARLEHRHGWRERQWGCGRRERRRGQRRRARRRQRRRARRRL